MPSPTTERSVVEVLRAARERITPIERWTRGAWARNQSGSHVGVRSPNAVCWCAEGALQLEAGDSLSVQGEAEDLLTLAIGSDLGIPEYNDGNTPRLKAHVHPRKAPLRHKRVLAAFDEAIELAEAEQS